MGDIAEANDADTLRQKLIDEFRSVVDDTTVIAIASDYDLTSQFEEARAVLLMLSSDAPAEEESGFNASGTGGGGYLDDLAGLDFPVESQTTDSTGSSRLHADISSTTDVSESLSERFETLELPQDVDISKLDDDGKATELRVMFPELKEVDITFALKKAGGDFMKACEDLLNTQYLEENGLLSRGIDGAFRLDGEIVYRKGKQSFVHQRLVPALSDPFPATTSSQSLPFLWNPTADVAPNKPRRAKLDVDYRLAAPPVDADDTDSTYAGNSARSITSALPARTTAPRATLPHPPPSPASASSSGTSSASSSRAAKSSEWQTVGAKRRTYDELARISSAARDNSNDTWDAVSRAARRGKSDHHFMTVAGVLAERARDSAARAKAAESETYDALVDCQSSSHHIDLHGVSVADGVRIAVERTARWWAGLGEDRPRRAREVGFTVVTGLGTHTATGVSQLRQAVGAALKREGWRVRTETGQYVVTGRQ